VTDEYPILVRDLKPEQALVIICEKCHTEETIGPDDLLNEGLYMCPQNAYGEPLVCDGTAIMKYEPADPCKGCGKLGFWGCLNDPLNGCCSRACMLQAEYAESLNARAVR
jgi:hypothetical protein